MRSIPAKDPATVERVRYFGCWLDFNQTTPRFPRTLPDTNPNGPYDGAESIQELLRGEHQCLVAEVYAAIGSDLIALDEGPAQSDKLAQRNLAIQGVPNPGTPATRTIQHSFDLKLSIPPDPGPF